MKPRRSLWLWVPTLFAAEEIPAAMVTFVALLMFLQMGASATRATLLSSVLFLPWVLKSFLRSWVRRAGHFRQMLHLNEVLLSAALFLLAAAFPYGEWCVFTALFLVSLLCSWHELLARMYYERMLRPRMQEAFNTLRIYSSQMAVTFTYGALILMVGTMEVFFRQIRRAWAMGCYVTAGAFLLFTLYHFFALRSPNVGDHGHLQGMKGSVRAELHVIERIRQRPGWWRSVVALMLLLTPQALMFNARVLFLLDKTEAGGLECTIQEVGFAQGTVGVLAFCLGITIGRSLLHWIPPRRLYWPLSIVLGLSPAIYLMMTVEPPTSLPILCVATFQAQFLFGTGLSICRPLVQNISGHRYRNAVNLLHIPLVVMCMVLPMAVSGWLTTQLGYHRFFLLDTLTAPLAWICCTLWFRKNIIPNNIQNEKTDSYGNYHVDRHGVQPGTHRD